MAKPNEASPVKVLDASFLASATALDQLPAPAFAEVAFAGRSNVGKSSLINSLLERRKLVRTSSTPGATRGINLFRVKLAGDATIDFADLPGYGYAKRSKKERAAWGPLIEGFLANRPGLASVVVIVDIRRGVEDDDRELVEYLEHVKRQVIVVATKLDKVPASQRMTALAKVSSEANLRALGYSAETGEGRAALWRRVLKSAHVAIPETPPKPKR
jgi:GTP-binding protein